MKMKAVILAAGEGKRLQPITSTRPKHLIKIGGKPILNYCLKALKLSGISEVVIVVNYMADKIQQYFGDGKKLGIRIDYVKQEAVTGTGNAVSVVEPHIKEEFMLVYGDLLFTTNAVKRIINLHQREKPIATMATVPVEKPEDYGIAEFEKEDKVKQIIEKPLRNEAPTNLANAGIYVFSMEIFGKLRNVSASPRGELEITDAISLLAKENTVLAAKLSKDEWLDVGKPWDLLDANRWILEQMTHKIDGAVERGAHLIGPITVAESARIRSGAYIEGPAFIDEESDVGPNCYIRPYTGIGKNTRIGNACEIKNSIIMDETHVGHLAYVGDSVIGEKCNLGAGTITANYRFDGGNVEMMVKDEVLDSGKRKLGVILGDNTKTGINTLFMPGVKVGINSWVGPNVVVERDVPANTVILLKQNVEKREIKK